MKKEKFLDFLEDEDIQEKIREIVNKQEKGLSFPSEENKLLKEEKIKNEDLQKQIEDYKLTLENEQTKNHDLQQNIKSLENENYSLKQKVQYYEKSFAKDLEMYSLYKSLAHSTKSSLENIFKDDSLQGFISCGVQERNITSLWDFIKTEITEERNHKDLVKIFYYLFEKYTLAYPKYELLQVSKGDKYDVEYHIKTGSDLSDNISEVLLLGWKNTKTDDIVNKSIVRL